QFPRFLYPDGREYDKNNLEDGLFGGHVMIRCAKHLLVGPASALRPTGYKKGRAGNAKVMGVNSITPRIIAYIAVQVGFALSDVQEWNQLDHDFNYQSFFWNILTLFED
ncbi:hypothetical protein GLOTRDRAFT_26664, partial [Gloeophyllum trabeum ATCC 11539]